MNNITLLLGILQLALKFVNFLLEFVNLVIVVNDFPQEGLLFNKISLCFVISVTLKRFPFSPLIVCSRFFRFLAGNLK